MSPQDRGHRAGSEASEGPGLPTPLAEVIELLAGESATSRTFLGGVVLGAVVGAAIAGASLVRHRANAPGPGRWARASAMPTRHRGN